MTEFWQIRFLWQMARLLSVRGRQREAKVNKRYDRLDDKRRRELNVVWTPGPSALPDWPAKQHRRRQPRDRLGKLVTRSSAEVASHHVHR